MSIRVYLKAGFVPTDKHPQGCHFHDLTTGARVNLSCEGGVFFFMLTSLMDPIHPEMHPLIACVTYKEVFTNMLAMGRVLPGSYRHGKFLADVERNGDGKNKIHSMTITAKAPTISLLARWLRPLLAAEDTPRSPKGSKPPPAPTPGTLSPTSH